MKKLICLALLIVFGSGFGQYPKISATKIETVAFDADSFVGFDGFHNYFYIKDNTLFKKSENNLMQYQNVSLGTITKIDILNPLKVIVFYEEFNTVIALDNQLNEIQRVDFSKLDTPIVTNAIGISGQNKLWFFNTLNQQIGLYDLLTNTSQNLGMSIANGVKYYQTDFNYFHWIDKQNQWNTSTIYGRISQNGAVEASRNLQLLYDNKLLYVKDNVLYLLDRNINKRYEIDIVEKSLKNFYYRDQILSIFTPQGITNYKIIIP
ncbi:MAG: hypothetical protein WCJ62_05445 [Flavobacterium sp.]